MKSTHAERAQRINTALSLIKKHDTVSKAADAMTKEYGVSRRQAYRYIHDARKIGAEIPIPDQKIAFTVKLSQSLILRLREYAKQSGQSLSEIVTQSLEVFLQNGRGQRSEEEIP
jgi:predicted DNA-binding transcriptional regulator YafY